MEPRELIQQEWAVRRERNPAFSLRSFAKFLELPPGRLSELLSGKRALTHALAQRIADRLGLPPDARAALFGAVRGRRRAAGGAVAATADPVYRQLTVDAFHVIAGWHHFAILSLRDCEGFRPDHAWIARRLGIGPHEVRLALTRLERLGLIERKGARGWDRTAAHLTTTHDVRSAGLRRGHRGILGRAIDALEEVDVAARDVTSMTFALDPARIPEAKKALAAFRRKFARRFETGTGRTEVYTLALQLFPLTRLKQEKKR
jgi:uncharacterized protein (TIGR02147 family)